MPSPAVSVPQISAETLALAGELQIPEADLSARILEILEGLEKAEPLKQDMPLITEPPVLQGPPLLDTKQSFIIRVNTLITGTGFLHRNLQLREFATDDQPVDMLITMLLNDAIRHKTNT